MPGGGIWGGFGGGGGAPAGGLGGSAPMPAATLASALAITSATFCSAADSLLLSANCQRRKQVERRRQLTVARLRTRKIHHTRTRYMHPVLLADTCRNIFIYLSIDVFIYLLKVASSLDKSPASRDKPLALVPIKEQKRPTKEQKRHIKEQTSHLHPTCH